MRRAQHVRTLFAVQHPESRPGEGGGSPLCLLRLWSVLFYRHVLRAERWFQPAQEDSSWKQRHSGADDLHCTRFTMALWQENRAFQQRPNSMLRNPLPCMSEVTESGAGKVASMGSAGQAPAATGHRVFSSIAAWRCSGLRHTLCWKEDMQMFRFISS